MGTARVVLRRSRNALFERHLLEQVARSADTVHNEQHVADVHGDIAADVRIEGDVAHRREPRAVEVDAHQFAAGVSTGDPELPPVVWFVARKQTGTVFLPPISTPQRP